MSHTKALIAMVLGDGHIDKHDRMTMKHCDAQKEYFDYKKNILKQVQQSEVWSTHYVYTSKQNGKQYSHYALATKKKPIYRIIKQWLEKGITRMVLDKLDAHAIAIWFMDDGSTTILKSQNGKARGTVSYISTHCSKEEAYTIHDYFQEVWGIQVMPHKQAGRYIMRMNTKEGKKFATIVKDYILPCVRYKIEPLLFTKDTTPRLEGENIV